MRATVNAILSQIAARKDLFFLAFLFIFVLMFIVPVPPGVIDTLISFNIAMTLVVIIAATYLKHPTELSTFPAIILFSTVFRLAITVASSRLILSQADAGEVIRAFGSFVIGGKLLVGLIVFLIVAIVLFIVVVKGVERIAEVGARFTLDALPGKQMSIDTDLRNGDITKEEARTRRTRLAQESQFFGAMDGAMRFVKGDAIAGFVIIFVNLLGGILVGMTSRGMSFGEASRTYSLLTVGEGLVSQIPAMLVAIAAGIVATRVAGDDSSDLGSDMAGELIANKQSLVIAGGAMALLSFMPGFPTLIFLMVAALLIGTGVFLTPDWHFWRKPDAKSASEDEGAVADAETGAAAAPVAWAVAEAGDAFQIAASPELANTLQANGLAGLVADRVAVLSRDFGFQLPRVSLRSDARLGEGAYRFELDEVPIHEGRWQGDAAPAFTDEVERVLRHHASTLFGLSEATAWLGQHAAKHQQLVTQLQQIMPMLRLVDICRRLLDEGVALSPPRTLIEAMIHAAEAKLDVTQSVEVIRKHMRRQIVYSVTRGASSIPALLLEPNVEAKLTALLRLTGAEAEANRSVDATGVTFANTVRDAAAEARKHSTEPVLVTTTRVRAIAQAILKRHGVRIPVVSLDEVGTETQIRPLRALTVAELGLA